MCSSVQAVVVVLHARFKSSNTGQADGILCSDWKINLFAMKMLRSCLVCFLALVSSGAVGNLRSQSSFMSSCWLLAAYKWRVPTSWCRKLDGLLCQCFDWAIRFGPSKDGVQTITTLNLTAWPYQVHGGLCFDVGQGSLQVVGLGSLPSS